LCECANAFLAQLPSGFRLEQGQPTDHVLHAREWPKPNLQSII
jgi:hypothetical protein